MNTVSTLVKLDMALGECPRWNQLEQAWYWVDILGQVLYRHQTKNGLTESRLLEFAPACFAFTQNNHIVLTGSAGVYWLADFSSDLEHIGHPEQHRPENRFNDGVSVKTNIKSKRLGRSPRDARLYLSCGCLQRHNRARPVTFTQSDNFGR